MVSSGYICLQGYQRLSETFMLIEMDLLAIWGDGWKVKQSVGQKVDLL